MKKNRMRGSVKTRIMAIVMVAVLFLTMADWSSVMTLASGQVTPVSDEIREGLWLTELETTWYPNTGKYEFVELTNTTTETIDFNSEYELLYGSSADTVAVQTVSAMSGSSADGSSDITIEPGETVVIWNRITTKTISDFRTYYFMPDDTKVFVTTCSGGWDDSEGYFALQTAEGEIVSSYSYTAGTMTSTGTGDVKYGCSVDLGIPDYGVGMLATARMTYPSPGYVYSEQLEGYTEVPEETDADGLFVTEVHTNDINRSATYGCSDDLMEYVEITNTTDEDIDFNTSDYALRYLYGTKDVPLYLATVDDAEELYEGSVTAAELKTKSGITIKAGETVVLWCWRKNTLTSWTTFPTEEEFRAAYGISDDVKVYAMLGQGGFNDTYRGVAITKLDEASGRQVMESYLYWHVSEVADGKSVAGCVSAEGPRMSLYAAAQTPAPGVISLDQVTYRPDDSADYGTITLSLNDGVPESISQGDELRANFTYSVSGASLQSITTYYSVDGGVTWNTGSAVYNRVAGLCEAIVSADELFSYDSVQFYLKASNGYSTTITDLYTVTIHALDDVGEDGIRTNISDGEYVSGSVTVTANDGEGNEDTKISIDGQTVTVSPVLEDGAYFSFLATGRDNYFTNALTTTENEVIAYIGYWQTAIMNGMVLHIDNSYFTWNETEQTYDVTLRFWTGTWGTLAYNETLLENFNQDDWKVTEMILKLSNGNEYLPTEIGPDDSSTGTKTNLDTSYSAVHNIGDSSGMSSYMDVSFSVPASEVNAVGAVIDTAELAEGEHTLLVKSGDSSKEVTFIVDNTAPAVSMGVEEAEELTGNIVINPVVSDNYGLADYMVKLDGEEISVPYSTTAAGLGEGAHVLSVYAEDVAGNVTTAYVNFTVADSAITVERAGTTNVTATSADAYLSLDGASDMEVTWYAAKEIETSNITTTESADGNILPYITYTLDVGEVSDTDVIVACWDGEVSNADDTHATTMYVKNITTGNWETIGKADSEGSIADASFTAADHVKDGLATILVQCTADSTLPSLDTTLAGSSEDDWDGYSIPENYDFAIAWETDTQFYAEQYYWHWENINNWIVDNADEMNISYVIHTGDIVDDWNLIYQWENADKAMSILEEAGIPYGVLGGNHDVAAGLGYNEFYYEYFGEDRVSSQTAYGDSYENNLGHYDLLSVDGQDLIIVYMSWNIYQDEIDWINDVLEEYSDRMAILCLHTYENVVTSSNGYVNYLDYTGNLLQKYVVAENPNVFMVLNGHYHGSSYAVDKFDDDNDGVAERTVYEICTDYQSGTEGGNGYLKMLYFDLENGKIYINSYSPSINDYNYYNSTVIELSDETEDGTWETKVDPLILNMEFDTAQQSITETAFSAYLRTDNVLGTAAVSAQEDGTAAGETVLELTELDEQTTYGWYAVVTNTNGNAVTTGLYTFTTEAKTVVAIPPADDIAEMLPYSEEVGDRMVEYEDYTAVLEVQAEEGIYTVTLSLKDKDNAIWEDGSGEDIVYTFTIPEDEDETTSESEGESTSETEDETTPESEGESTSETEDETTPESEGETTSETEDETTSISEDETTAASEDGTSSGEDTVTKIAILSVEEAQTALPYVSGETSRVIEYDNYTLTLLVQSDEGIYIITLSLIDKENTTWEDGSTGDIVYTYEISEDETDAPTTTKKTSSTDSEEAEATSANADETSTTSSGGTTVKTGDSAGGNMAAILVLFSGIMIIILGMGRKEKA